MKSCLLGSNPWLLEPTRRADLMRRSAASSSAVEGIVQPFKDTPARMVKSASQRPPRAKSGPARG